MSTTSVRALWVLGDDSSVCFSRRFPTVEKLWRSLCSQEKGNSDSVEKLFTVDYTPLPLDDEFGKLFAEHVERQNLSKCQGLRDTSSVLGTTDWLDDPITRHVISLQLQGEATGKAPPGRIIWPLVLHSKGPFHIAVLPLVEPCHLAGYVALSYRQDCGGLSPDHGDTSDWKAISRILKDLPSVTSAFTLAHVVADIIVPDPSLEQQTGTAPSVGGLLDSLSAGMGLPVRPKGGGGGGVPGPPTGGATAAMAPKTKGKMTLKATEKETLRAFLCSAMPFGTPLDLNPATVGGLRLNLQAPSSQDVLTENAKQPAWKPQLMQGGRQKILILIREIVSAALYDREDEVNDIFNVSGLVKCRCDLEGLPEVSLPLASQKSVGIVSLSVHPCCQAPESVSTGHTLLFTPPLGAFELAKYESVPENPKLPLQGFYQLQMVSEDEAQFLIKLKLMEGYRSPINMEFCTLSMPFPKRSISMFDGTPSHGTVTNGEHVVEWKIVVGGRGYSVGRSLEVTFPGTVKFLPLPERKRQNHESFGGQMEEIESEGEEEGGEEGSSRKGRRDMEDIPGSWVREEELEPADWSDPFCWEAYDFAKVTFKLVGGTATGVIVDGKKVGIYPAIRAPVEVTSEVLSGDYILFNSLGRYPRVGKPPPPSF